MANGRGGGHFDKPPLSSAELVDLMVRRGLVVEDRERARRALFHIGYYRLAPYLSPFQRSDADHQLRTGTTFEQVLALYSFDRDLRLLAMDALARIEVAFRAVLSEVMSKADNDSHWYTRPHYFSDLGDFRVLQGNVAQALEQPFPALQDYLLRYRTPELPPSWLMVEVLSIGQLTRVHKSLKRQTHRDAIARGLGSTDELLTSWLEVFVRVRNIAAHHERLWDTRLGKYPKVPHGAGVAWPENWDKLLEEASDTLYCVFSAVQSMLFTVSPTSPWAGELAALLEGHAMEREVMGFPAGWGEDPFWSRAITEGDPGSF
ncbi:Abi family protein [Tessaracoccus sp. OS52]|uniref:Abi family protein n=1 Tax=Tessaracoccus sp. OS52 TaxID=2886691 RepID=UPI001D10E305|nr:Abi family protein [Tessaracoccus sp. OS52]MCC2594078.1 Abi family protein [Tessaracoccus sp. OS52]